MIFIILNDFILSLNVLFSNVQYTPSSKCHVSCYVYQPSPESWYNHFRFKKKKKKKKKKKNLIAHLAV